MTVQNLNNFRVASFPVDLPLNGMASNAPFEFASEKGSIAVIRYVHLALKKMYPNLPVFISGRSTGGAVAISYAQHYDDICGAVAINPPYPDVNLLEYTFVFMEDSASNLDEILNSSGIALHPDSWRAFKEFMPKYLYPTRKSLSPTMIMISSNDPLNLSPEYREILQKFVDNDCYRELKIFNTDKNNLWDRKAHHLYNEVINSQYAFMSRTLGIE